MTGAEELLAKVRAYFGEDAEEGADWWARLDPTSLGECVYQSDSTFSDPGVEIIMAAIQLAQHLLPEAEQ